VNPLLWSHKWPEAEIEEKTPKHTRMHTKHTFSSLQFSMHVKQLSATRGAGEEAFFWPLHVLEAQQEEFFLNLSSPICLLLRLLWVSVLLSVVPSSSPSSLWLL
jgi:hypothetical protein